MKKLLLLCALLVVSTLCVLAQGPGGGRSSGGSDTLMVNTPKGLFVLRGGALARFDMITLKQLGVLELLGAMPAPPADQNDRNAMMVWYGEFNKRRAPAVIIPKDNSLLIILGEDFVRISQDTLAVEAQASLAAPKKEGDAPQQGFRMPQTPGTLLVGDLLYVINGTEIISINTLNGKIIQRKDVPKEMLPVQMPNNTRGGGNNGGGNRGGK